MLRVVSSDFSAVTVTSSASGVDHHDVLTGDDDQQVGVRRTQDGGTLAGDHQIGADRHAARHGQRTDGGAVGQTRKQLGAKGIRRATVDDHRRGDARQERARAQFVPLGLQHHRQFGQAEARAAVLLGDGQTRPPEVGGGRPDLGRMRGPLVEGRAGRGPTVHPVELAKHRVGQVGVFFGDGKG